MREHDIRSLSLSFVPALLLSACASELASEPTSIDAEPEVAVVAEPLQQPQPIDTITFNMTADTYVAGISSNKNYGTQKSLPLNRDLLMVDPTTLASAWTPHGGDYVVSAKLRLKVSSGLLVGLPRILSAYRVLKPWTESGATWNCAIDSNPSNNTQDCSGATKWSSAGGDIAADPSGSVVLPLAIGQATVEIDVSQDVRDFKSNIDNGDGVGKPDYGWLLKTLIELPLEPSSIASHESTSPPQLILQVRRCNAAVCDDGIFCSQDGTCSDEGFCGHLTAPPAPCNDNNACTIGDHCSGMDYTCVPGTPAPVGTACGSGLECDAQQQCVPVSP